MSDRNISSMRLPAAPKTYDIVDQRVLRQRLEQHWHPQDDPELRWVNVREAPYNAVGDGVANDTLAIQRAIDAVGTEVDDTAGIETFGGGVVWMPAGHYLIDSLTLKYGVRLMGAGQQATKLIANEIVLPAVPSDGVIEIAEGIVAYTALDGFSLFDSTYGGGGGNSGQHGLYIHAVPTLQVGAIQGGWWNSEINNLYIRWSTGDAIWLHGGDDSFQGPIQFIDFHQVEVEQKNNVSRALRMSGEVNQVQMLGPCRFDGPGKGAGGTNVLLERTCTFAGVNNGDISPNTVHWGLSTIQSNTRGVTIERAAAITFDQSHFEELDEGIYIDVSANRVLIDACYFGNVGHTGGGTGWGIKCFGGSCVVKDCMWAASSPAVAPDLHYWRLFGGKMELLGSHHDDTGVRTTGITFQTNAAATLDVRGYNFVYVNTSGTAITTIQSDSPPGSFLTLKAHNGPIRLSSGGNIYFDSGRQWKSPFDVIADTTVTLQRTDIQDWLIVAGLPNGSWNWTEPFGCNGATPQIGFAVGGGAPAGGVGTAAGGWNTAGNRDAAISLLNNIRAALIANGIAV